MKRSVPVLEDYQDIGSSLASLNSARGFLPLTEVSLTGRLTGLLYQVKLCQTFQNPLQETLEATCTLPLPGRAAVTALNFRVGDRLIEGEHQDRAQARQAYAAALRAGQQTGLVEQERPEVFTARVGSVPPGGWVRMELELAGPVDLTPAEATFRFPLVVAPRDVPGEPLEGASVGPGTRVDTDAVPDASRLSPPVLLRGQPTPVQLNLELALDPAGLPYRQVRSSLHGLEWDRGPGGEFILTLSPEVQRLDRDLILRIGLPAQGVLSSFLVAPDEQGGTFGVMLVPPGLPPQPDAPPQSVVFVLDRSHSMAGWKLAVARRAVLRLAAGLDEKDRFQVVLAGERSDLPVGEGLLTCNESERERVRFALSRVKAVGPAELGPALARALDLAQGGTVVLVSDGQVANESQILEFMATEANQVRLHALGVDRAANVEFLRSLAERTGGAFDLVESEERLEEILPTVRARLRAPLLTGLRLDGVEARELAPCPVPDLFPGQPLRIFGRYTGPQPNEIVVAGVAGSHEHAVPIPATLCVDSALRAAWARARVLDLEYRFDLGLESGERIRDFGVQWAVLCRFTALVAVDRSQAGASVGPTHQILQGVELPSGWEQPGWEQPGQEAAEPPPPEASLELEALEDLEPTAEVEALLESAPAEFAPGADQLFGVPVAEVAPPVGALFGAPSPEPVPADRDWLVEAAPATTDGMFGAPQAEAAPAAGGLFGAPPVEAAPADSAFFGAPPAEAAPADSEFFGAPSAEPAPADSEFFGAPSAEPAPPDSDFFGALSAEPAPADSEFVGAPSVEGVLFGAPTAAPPTSSEMFGAAVTAPEPKAAPVEPAAAPVAEAPPARPAPEPPKASAGPSAETAEGQLSNGAPAKVREPWGSETVSDDYWAPAPSPPKPVDQPKAEPESAPGAPWPAPAAKPTDYWAPAGPRPESSSKTASWAETSTTETDDFWSPTSPAASPTDGFGFFGGADKVVVPADEEAPLTQPDAIDWEGGGSSDTRPAGPAKTAEPSLPAAESPRQSAAPAAKPESETPAPESAKAQGPPLPEADAARRRGGLLRIDDPYTALRSQPTLGRFSNDAKPALMRSQETSEAPKRLLGGMDRKQRLFKGLEALKSDQLKTLLKKIEVEELVRALNGAPETLVKRIQNLLEESRARMFEYQMGQSGRKQTPAAIETSRGKVLRALRDVSR